MNALLPKRRQPWLAQAAPDAIIAWTSGVALVFFGLLFLDDAAIMGHTILALGLLLTVNESLKRHADGHLKLRLGVAIVFVALVAYGFLFPSLR